MQRFAAVAMYQPIASAVSMAVNENGLRDTKLLAVYKLHVGLHEAAGRAPGNNETESQGDVGWRWVVRRPCQSTTGGHTERVSARARIVEEYLVTGHGSRFNRDLQCLGRQRYPPGQLSQKSEQQVKSLPRTTTNNQATRRFTNGNKKARSERLEFCIPPPTSASSYYAGMGSMVIKYILSGLSQARPSSSHDETSISSPQVHALSSSGVQIIHLLWKGLAQTGSRRVVLYLAQNDEAGSACFFQGDRIDERAQWKSREMGEQTLSISNSVSSMVSISIWVSVFTLRRDEEDNRARTGARAP
ncbi:hypothetical protein CMUS01_11150 [Colletotrichum musicola]|uniref:Uncharacterized protein n=1 Tax=Colletotrichum musicola TaxID=2175873 RepID=A0A8H6K028_9PEZI|nr:hypothetical protein CMUS01_11150 [Colletotrichum musicola]